MAIVSTGDLVVVVKPTMCCGNGAIIGKIFKITGFVATHRCSHCGDTSLGKYALRGEGRWRTDIRRLKIIPPSTELSSEKKHETEHA